MFQKREFDLTDPDSVNQFLADLDPIPLNEQAELGQEYFFDMFRLEEDSPFADLITGMMDLLQELRDDREAKFVKGLRLWEATSASEPNDVPSSWEPFIDGGGSPRDVMFCLESGHALLARLLLAKAAEDHNLSSLGPATMEWTTTFEVLQGFSNSINLHRLHQSSIV